MKMLTQKSVIRTMAAISFGFAALLVTGCGGPASEGAAEMSSKSKAEQAESFGASPDPKKMAEMRAKMGAQSGPPAGSPGAQKQ